MSVSTSPAILAQKLKDVAIEQRRSGRTALNTFEFLQLVSLLPQQHAITPRLSIRADELEKCGAAKAGARPEPSCVSIWTTSSASNGRAIISGASPPTPSAISLRSCRRSLMSRRTRDHSSTGSTRTPTCHTRRRRRSIDALRQHLFRWLPDRLVVPSAAHAMLRKHHRALGLEERVDDLPLGPSDINAFVDRLARFMVAVVGGAFLLVPIIVMSFVNIQNWRLVVSSIVVLAFSAFLSLLSQASNQEVLGGAAAYAAVLVVFVGSALSSTSGGSKIS